MSKQEARLLASESQELGPKPQTLGRKETEKLFAGVPLPKTELWKRELLAVTPSAKEIPDLVAKEKAYQYDRALQKVAKGQATLVDIGYVRRVNDLGLKGNQGKSV